MAFFIMYAINARLFYNDSVIQGLRVIMVKDRACEGFYNSRALLHRAKKKELVAYFMAKFRDLNSL